MNRIVINVIGSPVDRLSWGEVTELLFEWSAQRMGRVICICNAHSLVTARSDSVFAAVIRDADLVTADGASVAAVMRLLGARSQERINGPDLMLKFCARAAGTDESIYLYGSSESTLSALEKSLRLKFPTLKIAGSYSPPFRPLTEQETQLVADKVNNSGAGTVWVSLGCPKQEKWMESMRGRIHCTMIGVGAAFDYHAGVIRRAPLWMQKSGLEWLHRLLSEPRRLWKRYLFTNFLFIFFSIIQLVKNVFRRKI